MPKLTSPVYVVENNIYDWIGQSDLVPTIPDEYDKLASIAMVG